MSYFDDCEPHCLVDDDLALAVQEIWRSAFPDATLLPVIGLPSNNNGVLTLTHPPGTGTTLRINGLKSLSPLSNGALYSAECAKPDGCGCKCTKDKKDKNCECWKKKGFCDCWNKKGKFLNLYEIQLPDLPGKNGKRSTGQIYINALHEQGLDVAGVHFHWSGATTNKCSNSSHGSGASCCGCADLYMAIHHQNVGMNPIEFSKRTICALCKAIRVIRRRIKQCKCELEKKCGCKDKSSESKSSHESSKSSCDSKASHKSGKGKAKCKCPKCRRGKRKLWRRKRDPCRFSDSFSCECSRSCHCEHRRRHHH